MPALLFALFLITFSKAQVTCYFNLGVFNTPANEPYIETYLTIDGNSLFAREINGKLQNSVNIQFSILKDSAIIRANKYNLNGPLFSDSVASPVFIDVQRYSLPNGDYTIEMQLTDKYNPKAMPFVATQTIRLAYNTHEIQSSGIQVLESFKKTTVPTAFSKNGFEMIPYTVNYFPETSSELSFYFEAYNTDTALGRNRPFIYYYYIEDAQSFEKVNSFVAFKKQNTARVSPLLTRMNIGKLKSGNYNLVVELKDENNITHLQQKFFFQRLNKAADLVALAELQASGGDKTIEQYFGSCNNADTLKMFVECLWPIANGVDKERSINQALNKDPELMKKFAIDFWQRRAGDTANPVKMWAAYYKNVKEAMSLFKCGRQPGYSTDRGRVYLQYGKPNQRAQQNAESNTYPYEIWQYYKISDRSNGQSFSNRRFVFVNKNLGGECYQLVHSDMRGEINNDQWRYEITRNKGNGTSDSNTDTPAGSDNNQFNDIYNNPR